MLTPQEQSETYRRVRSILVGNRIDLGLLSIHVGPMTLIISGRLQRLAGADGQLDENAIEAILGALRRINGVRCVNANFENWKQPDGRRWRPVEAPGNKPPEPPSSPSLDEHKPGQEAP